MLFGSVSPNGINSLAELDLTIVLSLGQQWCHRLVNVSNELDPK